MANFVDREALQEREQKFYNEYPMDTLKLQPLFSTTKYGMPIYKDQYEAIHSESSITLPIEINNEEKFITVSSIWPSDPEGKPSGSKELTGKYWKDYELRPFIRDNLSENKKFFINPITQERVPVFNTDTEANKYALDRDMSLQNVSEYRQDHIFQEGGNVMAEDNDNNNQQIYTREQMDKVGFSSWRGQDPEARLPVVNVGSVPAAVSLRDDWMGKKLEEPLTNREKEISAYLRIFTENPNPSIDITNQSQMRALEILNQIPHTHIQTGGAAIRSVLSNPDDPKNKAFINNNKRVLVQAFPILSKHDEGSGRGSFPIVKPQYNVGVGHEEQLQHQQGLVKKQPSVTKSTQSVRSDSVEEPETLGRPKFAKDDAFEEDQLNESRRDFLQKKINEYRIAIADGPDAQMKFARQLSENPNFSQDFKDAVFQSVDVGSPKRGFVSPTVSSVQEDDKRGDARLAESLFQSPKPRKPDRGPYEMGTKDYGRRKSLRNQTPEQKIANEVDQLRSANLISDTSQDMSGVASAIKTAMSQHEVNPDFTNSDTARAYQILQELPTNVQTGPATLSSLIENPTDEENRNFMKKHAPVLYQAFPALRAIYDRDIQSATPANIQDLADVVGLDNLPPAMQERILTKREAIEYEVTPQAKEKKWVDDFHDTEGLAARGGLIGYQMGAEVQTNPMRTGSEGFIGTREEGREDRAMALQNGDMGTDGVDATVDEGSFVLNSWAVALAGRQYIEELVKKAKQYIASPEGRAQLGNRELQPEEIDIRVSNGEYVFPPAMVEIIGRERLEKMNNRGIQAFEEEQRGRSQEVAMTMQGPEGLVPRPDQIPQNPAQEGDFDELEAMSQQQIGAHRGGTIGGTKGIMRDLKELFYGPEPDMLLVMGEKSDEKNKPSKRTGGFVSDNGSKKNYAEENLVDDNENFQTAFMNPIPYYTTKILPKIKETESDRFPPYKVPQETEEDYQRYLLEEQGEETGFVNPPIPSTKPIKPTESTKLPEKPNLSVLPYNQKISHNLGSLTIFEAWRDFYNISKPKEENTEKFNKWLKKLETFKENTKTKYGFAQQDTEMRHAAKIAGEIFDGDYGFGKKDIAEFLYVIGLHESLGGEVKVERQKKDVDAKRARGLFQVNPSTARSLIGTPNGYIGKKALNQILKEMGVEKKFENTKEAREYVKKYIRKDKSTFPISENFEKFLQNDVINAILAAAQLITQVTDTMQKSQYYADGGTVSSDDDDYLDHINNWFEGGKDWFKSGKEVTGGLRDSIGEIQDKMNKYGVGYTSKEGLSYRTPLLGGKLKFNLNPRKKSGGIEFKIPFST